MVKNRKEILKTKQQLLPGMASNHFGLIKSPFDIYGDHFVQQELTAIPNK